VVPNTTSTTHFISEYITTSGIFTLSFYAKANGYTGVGITNNPYQYTHFDLTGANAPVVGSGWTNVTQTYVGNGWYRCVATGTNGNSFNTTVIGIEPSQGSGAFTTFSGDGVSGILLAAPQLEPGFVASPYTPTTTSGISKYNNILAPNGNLAISNTLQVRTGGNVDITANALVLSSGTTGITTLTQTATGNLYTSAPTVTISAPTSQFGGVQATANANIGVVAIGNITSQGTNYTPGTVLTMVGNASTFSNATFVVTTVGNGVGGTGNVTSISLLTAGSYTIANTNPVTFTSSSGSGLQANLYYGVNTPVITNAGSGYVEQPQITFVGGNGTGAGAYATVGTPNSINATGANLSIVLPQGEVVKFVTSPVIAGVVNGNVNGNIGVSANSISATALTGNAIAAGGMGVVGNIYGTSRIGFTNVANSSSAAYTVYNSVYNSVDLIFGA
jgi:hypothetical protein